MPDKSIDELHKEAGTHPGGWWTFYTNTGEPEKYTVNPNLWVIKGTFYVDGKVAPESYAVFENELHKSRRLEGVSKGKE